jgi:hypothetical protein
VFGEKAIYRTRGEHANKYATDAVDDQSNFVEDLLKFT